MLKLLRNYLIAFLVVFVILLLVKIFYVRLAWGDAAILAAFLAVLGVGSHWWMEEGFR